MTVSRHTSTLLVGGHRYSPKDVDFVLDESRVPYASLSATLGADTLAASLNLLPNGGFEQGLDHWRAGSGTIDVVSEPVRIGGHALRITPTSGLIASAAQAQESAPPITFRETYRLTAWVMSPNGWTGGVWLTIQWLDADRVIRAVDESHTANLAPGEWTELQMSATSPDPDLMYATVQVSISGFPAPIDVLYVDDVSLTRILTNIERLDPRKPTPVLLTMRSDFGDGDTLATVSADYAGKTLFDVSAASQVLNHNPSFEEIEDLGAAGWEPRVTPVRAAARTGSRSMLRTPSSRYIQSAPNWGAPATPGTPYVAEAWIKMHTPGVGTANRVWLTIQFLDDAGVQIPGLSQRVFDGLVDGSHGGWSRVTGAWATPDDPRIATARVYVNPCPLGTDGETGSAYVDDVTLRYGHRSLASLTADYGRPYNSSGMRQSTRRRANLYLRSRTTDHATGTTTIEAASGEALLTDYALTDPVPLHGGAYVLACVNTVLARVLGTAVSSPLTAAQLRIVEEDARAWQPGETAWSYLTSITGSAGLRLWCDEVGLWHLEDPETARVAGGVAMGPDQATVLEDSLDREQNGWADSAVVKYEWTDANGDRRTVYDTTPAGTRTITRTEQRPFPGQGFANAIVRKARALGRVVRIGGVADYDVEPLQAAHLSVPGAGDHAGVVGAVQWRQPGDTMTVRTRDLMGIEPEDWLYLPPGRTWDDEPVGGSWIDEEVIPSG